GLFLHAHGIFGLLLEYLEFRLIDLAHSSPDAFRHVGGYLRITAATSLLLLFRRNRLFGSLLPWNLRICHTLFMDEHEKMEMGCSPKNKQWFSLKKPSRQPSSCSQRRS